MWNAFGWNGSTGLYLHVLDSSGREVTQRFTQSFDLVPPDETGKGQLTTIGGDTFTGFDTQIPVRLLVPGPGTYTIKCIYSPPLPRNYFAGSMIWGKEDGAVESAGVRVEVIEK
jgi:hypothetical protein